MHTSLIKSHLRTSNKYVQRQIVRDNIARLGNYMSTFKLKDIGTKQFRLVREDYDAQKQLLNELTKRIAEIEQTSFGFGGISSSY